MPKIETFDAGTFWKNAYVPQRGKLVHKVNVLEDQRIIKVYKKYVELPAALKYEIETSVIDKVEYQCIRNLY